MKLRTNARLAGIAFLLYIVAAMSGFIIGGRASKGDTPAAKLAAMAAHAGQMRVSFLFILIGCFCALVLAVTLWAITREVDRDLALFAALCRVTEGVTGAVTLDAAADRIWLATHAGELDAATRSTLAATHLGIPDIMGIGATFFAVGSTVFAWLLLRGRVVPVSLAWLGVVSSLAAVVVLPLRQSGVIGGPLTELIWPPLLVFEVWLAIHLLVKGAAAPAGARAA